MATAVTKSDLVGEGGSLELISDGNIVDKQVFAAPGGESAFVASLGDKGRTAEFRGILRYAGASLAAAAVLLEAQRNVLRGYERSATELDIGSGGSDPFDSIHDNSFDSVVIEGLQFGPVQASVGANRLIQAVTIRIRKLV